MPSASSHLPLTIERQVKRDFSEYWRDAEKNRLDDPATQRPLIASAHKYAMCFSYLSRAIAAQPVPLKPHQRVFFQELTSDTVHLVHALTGGDARAARFYLRSVIENFWRHHYFRDHVVEYGWLDSRSKYYLEMKELREHCSWLPCFQHELKPLLLSLPSIYSELSTAVHSSSSKNLVLRKTLEDIRLLGVQVHAMKRDVLNTLKVCLGLCIFSERTIYLGLGLEVQEYLMGALSANHQRAVKAALLRAETSAPAGD